LRKTFPTRHEEAKVGVKPAWLTNQVELLNSFSLSDRVKVEVEWDKCFVILKSACPSDR
jgi:hypothetical protein